MIVDDVVGDGMTARFAGEVALVTGGASGIGLATAQRLLEEGAWVVIADLNGDAAEAAAAVAFLASDDASFVTGVLLPVDDGYVAM